MKGPLMKRLGILFAFLILSSCSTGSVDLTKPLTPGEVQLITQVAAKHTMKNLSSEHKASARTILAGFRVHLSHPDMTPESILSELESALGSEYGDVAALAVLLMRERVNIDAMPNEAVRPYVNALITGLEAALK